jgi:hypothetical protein
MTATVSPSLTPSDLSAVASLATRSRNCLYEYLLFPYVISRVGLSAMGERRMFFISKGYE